MKVRRQLLALSTAGVIGIGGAFSATAPSVAAPSRNAAPVRIAGEAPPKIPWGAVRLGVLAPGTKIHLDVTLKVRDPAALRAYLAALSDKHLPLYHHFLRRGQFGPMFGPALSSVAAVQAALRRVGLAPGRVTSNRLIIPVTARAAVAERAFGTALVRYRLPGGRVAYANTAAPKIAAGVAPYVSGVIGLDNLARQQSMLARPSPQVMAAHHAMAARHAVAGRHAMADRRFAATGSSGPQPCSAATAQADATDGYTADELASWYLMSPLYGLGDLGAGIRVAVFEHEPNLTSDIAAYESCYGVATSVSYIKVDGGVGSGAGESEAALDIEDVLGLAPAIAVDVYQAPNSDTGVLDNYSAMITADKDAVISTSWGSCELYKSSAVLSAEQMLFEQANSQGQTVFAAAGDTGSTGCLPKGGPDAGSLSASDPSSQPYVIGVGGTTLDSGGELVWNESGAKDGAGGGGISSVWCMPSYQYVPAVPGLINSDSVTNSRCPAAVGHYAREDPDVTADADSNTGYVIYYSGKWITTGGTSAAAPLWAAVAALIDASPFCADYGSGNAGVLPQGLWATANVDHSYIYSGTVPEIVLDMTLGDNDYTPSGYTGGKFPATTGYDQASGLGSPLVTGISPSGETSMFYPGLAAAMCRAYATKLTTDKITGISPTSGPAAGGTTVTVTGSGFIPVPGADMAEIGARLIPATCPSTTTCTFKTPKHAAGTVHIRMIAEDYATSPATPADKFTYV